MAGALDQAHSLLLFAFSLFPSLYLLPLSHLSTSWVLRSSLGLGRVWLLWGHIFILLLCKIQNALASSFNGKGAVNSSERDAQNYMAAGKGPHWPP